MRHLTLESNSGIEQKIKIFIPFGFLKELLTKGFPNEMAESIEKNLVKDGTAILNVMGETRILINVTKLYNKRGIDTLQSIESVEISDSVVNSKEDINKLNEFIKELTTILPNITFSIVSAWTQEIKKVEIPTELSGVMLDKSKWHLTDKNIDFIRGLEGRARLKPFWDRKHWAIGYGHGMSSQFEQGESITLEKAEELYRKDLVRFEKAVKSVINTPMTLDMYAACVAFAYNAGGGGFRKSDIANLINQQKYKEAYERWKTERIALGTNVEKGLRRRREREATLFLGNNQKNLT